MSAFFKHHALALAIALAGLASGASAQTLEQQEELSNPGFTRTATNRDPLRAWNDRSITAFDRQPVAGVNLAARFDDGTPGFNSPVSFLSQELGTFARGTWLDLDFVFGLDTRLRTGVARNFEVLRFGFQTFGQGTGWQWTAASDTLWSSSPTGLLSGNGGQAIFGFDPDGARVRVAFEGMGGIEAKGYRPWVDDVSVISNTLTAAPVPEPETWAMLLAGLGALGFLSRRRQASVAA